MPTPETSGEERRETRDTGGRESALAMGDIHSMTKMNNCVITVFE